MGQSRRPKAFINVLHQDNETPYTMFPVAELNARLGHLSCLISKGDILLSEEDLDWVGQCVGSKGGGNSRGF